MSLDPNTQFDVVGAGYVPEHHDDGHHRYLADTEQGTIGVAIAWLMFYAMAVVVTVVGSFQKTTNIV